MTYESDLELLAVRTVLVDEDRPSAAAKETARASLLELIDAEARSSPGFGARRRNGWRRWRPAIGLAGTAAVAAVVVLVSQVLLVGGGAVQPPLAAAAVLHRAADAALASPPPRLRSGQYWYEENQGTYLDAAGTQNGVLEAFVSQTARYWIGTHAWVRRDRTVRVRTAQPITRPWQRAILATFTANPSLNEYGASYDLPVSYKQMLRYPTALPALADIVLHPEGARRVTLNPGAKAQIMFTAIHDILVEPMVPARVQAGLFRLAATIPGIQLRGLTHDSLGRAALAVGFVDHRSGFEDEFLFDPVSYALLDYRETARNRAGPYLPAGTVMQETAFLRAGLVHRIGQAPAPSGTESPPRARKGVGG